MTDWNLAGDPERIELGGSPQGIAPFAMVERFGQGDKTPVLFLHGWLMGPYIWSALAPHLPMDREFAAVWQPAHGPAPSPDADFTLDRWVDWLDGIVAALGWDRCVVVGHSMGSIAAQHMIHRKPHRLAGAALVGAPCRPWEPQEKEAQLGASAQVVANWSEPGANMLAAFLLGQPFLAANPDFVPAWAGAVSDYDRAAMPALAQAYLGRPGHCETLAGFERPLAAIHGQADVSVSPDAVTSMAMAVGQERFHLIAEAGHCPPLETPAETAAIVVDLLTKVEGAG
tara:strand:+ start:981 stop:1835 length:855 start_codon:yes stop_codon:yes gene_type:complete